jgi:hypothetical protein
MLGDLQVLIAVMTRPPQNVKDSEGSLQGIQTYLTRPLQRRLHFIQRPSIIEACVWIHRQPALSSGHLKSRLES